MASDHCAKQDSGCISSEDWKRPNFENVMELKPALFELIRNLMELHPRESLSRLVILSEGFYNSVVNSYITEQLGSVIYTTDFLLLWSLCLEKRNDCLLTPDDIFQCLEYLYAIRDVFRALVYLFRKDNQLLKYNDLPVLTLQQQELTTMHLLRSKLQVPLFVELGRKLPEIPNENKRTVKDELMQYKTCGYTDLVIPTIKTPILSGRGQTYSFNQMIEFAISSGNLPDEIIKLIDEPHIEKKKRNKSETSDRKNEHPSKKRKSLNSETDFRNLIVAQYLNDNFINKPIDTITPEDNEINALLDTKLLHNEVAALNVCLSSEVGASVKENSKMNISLEVESAVVGAALDQRVGAPMDQGVGALLSQEVGAPLDREVNAPLDQGVGTPLDKAVGVSLDQGVVVFPVQEVHERTITTHSEELIKIGETFVTDIKNETDTDVLLKMCELTSRQENIFTDVLGEYSNERFNDFTLLLQKLISLTSTKCSERWWLSMTEAINTQVAYQEFEHRFSEMTKCHITDENRSEMYYRTRNDFNSEVARFEEQLRQMMHIDNGVMIKIQRTGKLCSQDFLVMERLATAAADAQEIAKEAVTTTSLDITTPTNLQSIEPTKSFPKQTHIFLGEHWAKSYLMNSITSLTELEKKVYTKLPSNRIEELFYLVKIISYFAVECMDCLTKNGMINIIITIEKILAIYVIEDSIGKFEGAEYDCTKSRNIAVQCFVDVGDYLRKLRYRFGVKKTNDLVSRISILEVEASCEDVAYANSARLTVSEKYFRSIQNYKKSTPKLHYTWQSYCLLNVEPCIRDLNREREYEINLMTVDNMKNTLIQKSSVAERNLRNLRPVPHSQHKLWKKLDKVKCVSELLKLQNRDLLCGNCQETKIYADEEFLILSSCKHVFCVNCIDEWLTKWKYLHPTENVRCCKICRKSSEAWTTKATLVKYMWQKKEPLDKLLREWHATD